MSESSQNYTPFPDLMTAFAIYHFKPTSDVFLSHAASRIFDDSFEVVHALAFLTGSSRKVGEGKMGKSPGREKKRDCFS